MEIRDVARFTVEEESQAGEVRRGATGLARNLGFGATDVERAAIIAKELATNTIKHGNGGELLLRRARNEAGEALEMLALDRGPGMRDIGACMRDGFSTAGSAGTGFGAVRRLASLVEIHSAPGQGTAVLAHVASNGARWPAPFASAPFTVSGICLPKSGEQVSGDDWASHQEPSRLVLLVADGLGHGPSAAEASAQATQVLRRHPSLAPGAILERTHQALRATRGAAVAVAEVDATQHVIRFAGVGNIAGVVETASPHRMVSHGGIVGHEMRRVREFLYAWSDDALLIMHSDGLGTHWDLKNYPGLAARHPSLIAGILYRDHSRRRDDVSVVVARRRVHDPRNAATEMNGAGLHG